MSQSKRYIDINGVADIIDFPQNPTTEDVNDWIRDYLRCQGNFSSLLRPVEGDDIYTEGEYLEIRIIVGRKLETEDEEFIGQAAQVSEHYQGEY
tara:strand:- start:489 stop:770 length:282 start_codon:yes stop_codon:yes gene_type:complete